MSTVASPPVEVAESRFTAALYDPFLWLSERLGMAARRRELLAEAHGAVLEIGAGTGLNLRHYPTGLEELVLVEPGEPMADRVDLSRAPDGVQTRLVRAPAEQLPFADGTFDTVVSTLVLCTVSDPARAVSEVARVLRPGGRLLFCEHVGGGVGLAARVAAALGTALGRLRRRLPLRPTDPGDDRIAAAGRVSRAWPLARDAGDRQAAGLGQRGCLSAAQDAGR